MVYLIYPDTPHVYIYIYIPCVPGYTMIKGIIYPWYVCVSSFTQNGCSLTEYGQGCLNFASATFHDVKIPLHFSIPKISNYRRYHPQMVALRQWLSHMIHPLGHPWAIPNGPSPNRGAEGRPWNTDGTILLAFPRAKSGEPRDSHHVLIMFPSWPWLQVWGPTWNPFLQLKRGSSLEVSKWSSDMIMIFPLFQVRIMQISFLHPYFQFVSSDDPGSRSGVTNLCYH